VAENNYLHRLLAQKKKHAGKFAGKNVNIWTSPGNIRNARARDLLAVTWYTSCNICDTYWTRCWLHCKKSPSPFPGWLPAEMSLTKLFLAGEAQVTFCKLT
jgi:hypothetical protein